MWRGDGEGKNEIIFLSPNTIYSIAAACMLRYRYSGKPCVCEYLINILPCPEGKINSTEDLCLPDANFKTHTCKHSALPLCDYLLGYVIQRDT